MLQALASVSLAALVAGQPAGRAALPVQSPYLDAVRRYGPGTEGEAVAALHRLRLRDPDLVFEALDDRVCTAAGAFSCTPVSLVRAGIEARERVAATWRQLYPRALALHVEALASTEVTGDVPGLDVHRLVLLRLIRRLEEIAREPDVPDEFSQLAMQGRRLLVWTHQLLRDVTRLAATLDTFAEARIDDPELGLARAALAELRALPEAVRLLPQVSVLTPTFRRDAVIAQAQARQLESAVRIYQGLIAGHPALLEAHLRLGHLLARLGRLDAAEAHLAAVSRLNPDDRQAYLSAVFLADVHERRGRTAEAIAAYEAARGIWPGSQAPLVALARLRGLRGDADGARAALAGIHVERDMRERTDPWMGYIGGQAWRLPAAITALQASFEPLR
jgi:tetratricopeptide (TPR) repeat protein